MHEIRRKCYEGRPRKSEQFLSEAFEVDLVSVEANWSTKRSAVTRDATLCFCKFSVPFYLFQKIMLGQDGPADSAVKLWAFHGSEMKLETWHRGYSAHC